MTAVVVPIGQRRQPDSGGNTTSDTELDKLRKAQRFDALADKRGTLPRSAARESLRDARHGAREADQTDLCIGEPGYVAPHEGRHDARRLPAGYELADGCLARRLEWADDATMRTCDEQTRALLLALASNYVGSDGASLLPAIERLLDGAQLERQTLNTAERIESACRAFDGAEPARPEWQAELVDMLSETARRLAEIEACKLRNMSPASPPPRMSYSIRSALVQRLGEAQIPPALTIHAIDNMIAKCGLGGGGPHGQKTAHRVVDDWIRTTLSTKKTNKPKVIRRRKLE